MARYERVVSLACTNDFGEDTNFLTVYEKTWNENNYWSTELLFLEKKLNRLKAKKKLSTKDQQNITAIERQQPIVWSNKEKAQNALLNLEAKFKIIYKNEGKNKKNKQANKDLTDYISYGRAPDAIIELPLKDEAANENIANIGLELEPMLAKMKTLVTDHIKFDLYSKNCSATILAILAAGITKADRNWLGKSIKKVNKKFKDRNGLLFSFVTPQNVYNTGMNIQKNIAKHNKKLGNLLKSNKPMPIKKFYSIVKIIKNFFINKKAHQIVNNNRFNAQQLPGNIKEFNDNCIRELENILNTTVEYLEDIKTNPTKYSNLEEKNKLNNIIDTLTKKRIRLADQMHHSEEHLQKTDAIVTSIGKNITFIPNFLNDGWVKNQASKIHKTNR